MATPAPSPCFTLAAGLDLPLTSHARSGCVGSQGTASGDGGFEHGAEGVALFEEVSLGGVEDVGEVSVPIEDVDVPIGHRPGLPHGLIALILQPGQVAAVGDGGVSVRVADLIESKDLRVDTVRVEVLLNVVEGAKLAPAVTSRRVAEVPGGGHPAVI